MDDAKWRCPNVKPYSRTQWRTKAGRPSYRGADHLIVALYYARLSPINRHQWKARSADIFFGRMFRRIESFFSEARPGGKTEEAEALFRASWMTLGNMSPSERPSRGMSVSEGS